MLTDKDLGIKKFILARIMQIDDEIVKDDPEYKELEERPNELQWCGGALLVIGWLLLI